VVSRDCTTRAVRESMRVYKSCKRVDDVDKICKRVDDVDKICEGVDAVD
jgi:hypothetical protein